MVKIQHAKSIVRLELPPGKTSSWINIFLIPQQKRVVDTH